jgi:hypothetical protein
MIQPVYQAEKNGGWIACVSMLTGVEYADIRAKFNFRDEVTSLSAAPVVELLSDLGYECARKSTKLVEIGSLKNLGETALVYSKNLSKKGKETHGHWMVWDGEAKVLHDPEGWCGDHRQIIKNFRIVRRREVVVK